MCFIIVFVQLSLFIQSTGELEEEEYDEEYEYSETVVSQSGGIAVEGIDVVPTEAADIWASYDAINETPATPLLDDVPSDPNYQLAKATVLSQVEDR